MKILFIFKYEFFLEIPNFFFFEIILESVEIVLRCDEYWLLDFVGDQLGDHFKKTGLEKSAWSHDVIGELQCIYVCFYDPIREDNNVVVGIIREVDYLPEMEYLA